MKRKMRIFKLIWCAIFVFSNSACLASLQELEELGDAFFEKYVPLHGKKVEIKRSFEISGRVQEEVEFICWTELPEGKINMDAFKQYLEKSLTTNTSNKKDDLKVRVKNANCLQLFIWDKKEEVWKENYEFMFEKTRLVLRKQTKT